MTETAIDTILQAELDESRWLLPVYALTTLVTLVRDPVARNISDYFHRLAEVDPARAASEVSDELVAALGREFLERFEDGAAKQQARLHRDREGGKPGRVGVHDVRKAEQRGCDGESSPAAGELL